MIELSFENKLETLNGTNKLDIYYFSNFLSKKKSDLLYKKLYSEIPWQKYQIKIFGKTYDQPRLTSFHSIGAVSYTHLTLPTSG